MNYLRVLIHAQGIYELNINHPESENRISEPLCVQFKQLLGELREERDLKVLVLTGGKKVFCAGASKDLLGRLLSGVLRVKDLFDPRLLLRFPAPVLGALEGSAVGGGLAMVLGCDVLVGAERARYGFNFAQMGFTPELGTSHLLPLRVGPSFATEMLMTSKLYLGRELSQKGLFEYAPAADGVRAKVWDLATRMAECSQETLRMLKETLTRPLLKDLDEALALEDRLQAKCFAREVTGELVQERYLG